MQKPRNYSDTQAYSSFTPLPPGGYVCQIKKIEQSTAKSGSPMLLILLDIYEGEFVGHYERDYRANTRPEKRWGCTVYQTTTDQNGDCSRGLKTFCEAVEASNAGFSVEASWGDRFCENYKGKLVGGLFRREAYINSRNEEKWVTRCFAFRNVEDVRAGIDAPADKPLSGDNARLSSAPTANDYVDLDMDDDDLPF